MSDSAVYISLPREGSTEKETLNTSFKHLHTLMPRLKEYGKISDLVDLLLPSHVPSSIHCSNVSLGRRKRSQNMTILIRLASISPRIQSLLGEHRSLALKGEVTLDIHLGSRFTLVEFMPISHSEARHFERTETVLCYLDVPNGDPVPSVFTPEWLGTLPNISEETERQAQRWQEYIQWKKTLIRERAEGVRVLINPQEPPSFLDTVEWTVYALVPADVLRSTLDMLTRFKNRREDLCIMGNHASRHQWTFELDVSKKDHWSKRIPFQRLLRFEEISNPENSIELDERDSEEERDIRVVQLTLGLNHRDQESWNNAQKQDASSDSDDESSKVSKLVKRIEQDMKKAKFQRRHTYFLTTQFTGDWTLLNRYQDGLNDLIAQGGYSPFIASYLFTPENIRTRPIQPIDTWHNPNLNDAQKKAVEKALAAPDFALLQGPPGTGKTTVISEITSQLVSKGERVFIASQSNTAVDNALERLEHQPEIRVIRIGKSGKIDADLPYQEDRVLEHFFSVIAEGVEAQMVQPIDQATQEISTLQSWLQKYEMLMSRLSQEKEAESNIVQHLERTQGAFNHAKRRHQEHQYHLEQIPGLQSLQRDVLNGSGNMDSVSAWQTDFQEEIQQALGRMPTVSLAFVNVTEGQWMGLCVSRQRLITQVCSDQEALCNGRLSEEGERELKRLKEHEQTLRLEMAEDIGLYPDWKACIDQIKLLKEKEPSIDLSVYQEWGIDCTMDNPVDALNGIQSDLEMLDAHFQTFGERVSAQISEKISQWSQPFDEDLDILTQAVYRIQEQKETVNQEVERLEQQCLELQVQLPESFQDVAFSMVENSVRVRLKELEDKLNARTPIEETMLDLQRSWVDSLRQTQSNEEVLLDYYLQTCNVIGATCTERSDLIEKKTMPVFDTIIIDEVSKATPLEMLMPMMSGRRVILVGDHRQLPPTFSERVPYVQEIDLTEDTSTVLTKENVDKYRDLVSASLFKRHFEKAPQDIKEMLWIQYRMHPQIMRLVNYFYDNRLQCGLSNPDQQRAHDLTLNNDRGFSYISPQDHAVWIDSSKDHNGIEYFEGQSGSSKINLLEVKMIGQLLLDINTQQAAKRRSIDVGVISFYGHQVREIRKEIRRLQSQKKLTHIKVSTDTVDRFQGKENSIILVSLVRNQRSARSRRNKHVTQFERINVALSRAQKLLVVVGAKNFFADVLVNMPEIEGDIISEQRTYQHMIAQMNTDGRFKTSRELLPQDCVIPSSGVRTGSVWDELNVGDLTSVQVATIKENGIEVTFTEIDSQARGFIHQRQLQKKDVNRYTEGDVLQGQIHKIERPSRKKRRGSILINEVRNG